MKKVIRAPSPESLAAELSAAELPDRRLKRRLATVAEAVATDPSLSFPNLSATDAELEATYRFLSNPRVRWHDILAPHVAATAQRAERFDTVLVIHDSSHFYFPGESPREGLGHLSRGNGFIGHFALAVGMDAVRSPLGLLGIETIFRSEKPPRTDAERRKTLRRTPREERESGRWSRLAIEASKKLAAASSAVHVMDREADDYFTFSELGAAKARFVIRADGDRRIVDPAAATVLEALAGEEAVLVREVPIAKRNFKNVSDARIHPPREARLATLQVRWRQAELCRPIRAPVNEVPATLSVNVVEIFEPAPPAGVTPIQWALYTNEPVGTLEDATRIVDIYRARWTIEEYFKALKTGCAFEKRQLESAHALLNTLAVLATVAWRLLLLRTAARAQPRVPASYLFTTDELLLLRAISKRVKLPANPSLEATLLAIAGLGGHLKRNGAPGWQVIGRGYDKLSSAYVGWLAARTEM